jgi:hypothetical protein
MSNHYFAWTGGDPLPPVTVTTTGDVWSGSKVFLGNTWNGEYVTIGDCFITNGTNARGTKIENIRNPEVLVNDGIYHVDGPGLKNNRGRFDGVDRMDLVNLVDPVGEAISITFSTPADETFIDEFGHIQQIFLFTEIVHLLDPSGLAIGSTYNISGPGIKPNAYFVYEGGNDISLQNFGDPTNPFDDSPLNPGATVTAAGVELTISLLEGQNILSNVPDTSEFTVGEVYQIFGKGVADAVLGTYLGGGSFLLSEVATSTEYQTPLRIHRGTIYPDGGAFVESEHARFDEEILSVILGQNEGDFATFDIEVKNPRIGLIAPGRNLWCWYAYQLEDDGPIVPMLHGRLAAVPTNIVGEKVTFKFIASPGDYDAQRIGLMGTLMQPPHYAAEWFDNGRPHPDNILEARAATWDTDRTTLAVSITDMINGEAGTLEVDTYEVDGSEHLYGETNVDISSAPVNGIYMNATAQFTQEATGTVDLTPAVKILFGSDQSEDLTLPIGSPFPGRGRVSSYCGDGLVSSWPKPKANIAGGWSFGDGCFCTKLDLTARSLESHYIGRYLNNQISNVSSSVFGSPWDYSTVTYPLNFFEVGLTVDFQAKREWTEVISFFMESDIQDIVSDSRAHTETVNLTTNSLSLNITPDGTTPLYDTRSNTFFKTDYGRNVSFPFLVAYAKAKLTFKARAVTIEITVPFWKALGISCRHNVHVIDERIPGGQATGKVIGYEFTASASAGEKLKIKIGCCIGKNGTVAPSPGTGAYVQDGYFADNASAQTQTGATIGDDTITYQSFDELDIVDDGLNLFDVRPEDVVTSLKLIMGPNQQVEQIRAVKTAQLTQTFAGSDIGGNLHITTVQAPSVPPSPADALKNAYTRIEIGLVPVTGSSFISNFVVDISKLQLPKTIDLEAPSNA